MGLFKKKNRAFGKAVRCSGCRVKMYLLKDGMTMLDAGEGYAFQTLAKCERCGRIYCNRCQKGSCQCGAYLLSGWIKAAKPFDLFVKKT